MTDDFEKRVDKVFDLFVGYDDACEEEPWRRKHVADWLRKQDEEVEALRDQRDALQERCNRLLVQARGLRYQVDSFHEKYGHARPRSVVSHPPDELVRFRLRLIAEEFLEVVEAAVDAQHVYEWSDLEDAVEVIDECPIKLDLPAFVDGLADLDYVVEGTRITLGIDGRPIAAEVHRANMDKVASDALGKPTKPEGWKPPDIEGELRKQGWLGYGGSPGK